MGGGGGCGAGTCTREKTATSGLSKSCLHFRIMTRAFTSTKAQAIVPKFVFAGHQRKAMRSCCEIMSCIDVNLVRPVSEKSCVESHVRIGVELMPDLCRNIKQLENRQNGSRRLLLHFLSLPIPHPQVSPRPSHRMCGVVESSNRPPRSPTPPSSLSSLSFPSTLSALQCEAGHDLAQGQQRHPFQNFARQAIQWTSLVHFTRVVVEPNRHDQLGVIRFFAREVNQCSMSSTVVSSVGLPITPLGAKF